MQKKSLIILIVLLVVGSVITALYMWNKPKRTAADEEATATLTASELYAAYTADAGAANLKFLDKVIIVSGQVVSLDTSDKGITTVTLETADPMGAVTCSYSPGNEVTAAVAGQITLKGICTGIQGEMMPSVVLSQCTEAR